MGEEKGYIKKHFDGMAAGQWQAYYDKEKLYASYNFLTRKEAVPKLLRGIIFDNILDVGCGSGEYLDIAKIYKCQYFGIDFSEKMVAAAIEKSHRAGLTNIHLCCANAENLPYRNRCFDVVLGIGLIEYFNNPTLMLEELRRVLKPRGILIMQSYRENFYDLHSKATYTLYQRLFKKDAGVSKKQEDILHKRYSKNDLDKILGNHGFTILDYAYNNFRLIPYPIDCKIPSAYVRTSEFLTRVCPRHFGFFASNYIAKYQINSR